MAKTSKRLEAAQLLLIKRRQLGGGLWGSMLDNLAGPGWPSDEEGLLKIIAEEKKKLEEADAREKQEAELARQRKIEEDRHEAQMSSMREEENRKREEWELFKRQKELELRMREAGLRRMEGQQDGGCFGAGFDRYDPGDL